MRKTLTMTLAAAAVLAAGALTTGAQAAPASALPEVAKPNGLVDNVAYVCRRVWRYGYWQRRCFYTGGPGYGYGYGYGGPSYFYGGGPYYGYGGGYRRWRRW